MTGARAREQEKAVKGKGGGKAGRGQRMVQTGKGEGAVLAAEQPVCDLFIFRSDDMEEQPTEKTGGEGK